MNKEELKNYQNHYVDQFLEKTSNGKLSINLKSKTKELLQSALENTKHPRYDISLGILRKARKNISQQIINQPTTQTPERNINSMIKMGELGIPDETIGKIFELLYHKSLNYRNTIEKIRSLGEVFFAQRDDGVIMGYTLRDTQKNLENGVGGVCQNLAVMYKHLFDESNIKEIIKQETKLNIDIKVVYGQDREYFNLGEQRHVFCKLIIGDQIFIIDPSIGEINTLQQSGYTIIDEARQQTNFHNINILQNYHNSLIVNNIETNDSKITENSNIKIENLSTIFLGYFDNTNLFCDIGWGINKKTRKIYPLLLSKNHKDNNKISQSEQSSGVFGGDGNKTTGENSTRFFAMLTDENNLLSRGEKISPNIIQKVLETLKELEKISPSTMNLRLS